MMTNRKDPLLCKLPPQNVEAEETLISAVLIDNSTLSEIVEILSPDDFYKYAHKKIFGSIIDLYKNNVPVDLVTLSNRLRDTGEIENAGAAVYLSRIVDTAPMAVNAGQYAEIVHAKATLRQPLTHGNAIVNRCLEDQGDVEEVFKDTFFRLPGLGPYRTGQFTRAAIFDHKISFPIFFTFTEALLIRHVCFHLTTASRSAIRFYFLRYSAVYESAIAWTCDGRPIR